MFSRMSAVLALVLLSSCARYAPAPFVDMMKPQTGPADVVLDTPNAFPPPISSYAIYGFSVIDGPEDETVEEAPLPAPEPEDMPFQKADPRDKPVDCLMPDRSLFATTETVCTVVKGLALQHKGILD